MFLDPDAVPTWLEQEEVPQTDENGGEEDAREEATHVVSIV